LDTEQLFNRLVENAFDFLARSTRELRISPKYSVIHFHTAVELFLKARLMADHWSLVVTKRQDPDWDKFVAGDFQSVSIEEAALKLKKAVKSGLTDKELRAFMDVTRHRNKMVHFFHEAHTTTKSEQLLREIAKQQLYAWYLLNKIIRGRWRTVFERWSNKIDEIDEELRNHHGFLQVVFDHKREEINKRKGAGSDFHVCPSCGFLSQEHQQEIDKIYEADCMVCGLIEKCLKIKCLSCSKIVLFVNEGFSKCESCGEIYDPGAVVEFLLDKDAAHIAALDGDDSWDIGNCSNCDGFHTVVRIDDEHYVCTSCFEKFDSIQWCGWCNEPNTGDMEYSYIDGCNHCEGKVGRERD